MVLGCDGALNGMGVHMFVRMGLFSFLIPMICFGRIREPFAKMFSSCLRCYNHVPFLPIIHLFPNKPQTRRLTRASNFWIFSFYLLRSFLSPIIIPHLGKPKGKPQHEDRSHGRSEIPVSHEMWPDNIFLVPVEDRDAEECLCRVSALYSDVGHREGRLTATKVPGKKNALSTAITFITLLSLFARLAISS